MIPRCCCCDSFRLTRTSYRQLGCGLEPGASSCSKPWSEASVDVNERPRINQFDDQHFQGSRRLMDGSDANHAMGQDGMRWLMMVRGAGSELGLKLVVRWRLSTIDSFSLARSPGPVVSAPCRWLPPTGCLFYLAVTKAGAPGCDCRTAGTMVCNFAPACSVKGGSWKGLTTV